VSQWITRANDRSLEALILLGRAFSVLAVLGFIAFSLVVFWARDDHTRSAALASLMVCLALAVSVGALCWLRYGNAEWAKPVTDGARWGDMECRIRTTPDGTHQGPHWDDQMDPRAEHTWS
jgi:hypothetical protein